MSATTKLKVNKFMKTKRIDGELEGLLTFTFRWPLICSRSDEYTYVSSSSQSACGTNWCVYVYPNGIDETSEFLSVRLVNLSSEEVYASYSLKLRHQKSGNDHCWKDPEGIVLFSAVEDGDNAWGCDDFIPVQDMYLNDDYTAGEKIVIQVALEVFGRDYLKTETLSQAIQDTAEKSDIIKLADEEIYELAKKLPVLRDSVAQKRQEDGIVKFLNSTPGTAGNGKK
jgi:hypothetical protein